MPRISRPPFSTSAVRLPAALCALVALGLALAAPPLSAQEPPLRVIELRGARPGPTVALVAGVHGGKVAASRALEQLARRLRAGEKDLRGRVLIVPVANQAARHGGLAQLSPDGLNLNRVFPGKSTIGARATERLAARILYEVVARSDFLIDLHGSDGEEAVGSFAYAARPGITPRVDSAALDLARAWGSPRVVWDSEGPRTLATSQFLQTAAHLSGVPAITVFEAGDSRESDTATAAFVRGAERVLATLGVLVAEDDPPGHPPVHARREVATAPATGRWTPAPGLRPGARIKAGELLGVLADSSAGKELEVRASVDGVILHQRLGNADAGSALSGTPLIIIAVGDGNR